MEEIQPYWVYPSNYEPQFTFEYEIPRLEFFDLPQFLGMLKDQYKQFGKNRVDYSWEAYERKYQANVGNLVYWALRELGEEYTYHTDNTELDVFYDPLAIPRLLDLLMDKEYHSSVYALLLEYYPEDKNLQTWYQQSLCTPTT